MLAITATLFSACKDDDPTIVEDPSVVFDFSSPISGAMYGKGDTVFIDGMISYTKDLHGYKVSITNTSNSDTVVFNNHEHIDSKTFHIHEHWVNNVNYHSNMMLKIEAITDHAGTSETKELMFHCHPM
ncbi:MAG: hypothetical protein ACI8SE_000272 [Bacteroidia bacterium]|jgi:hypothetical protein